MKYIIYKVLRQNRYHYCMTTLFGLDYNVNGKGYLWEK